MAAIDNTKKSARLLASRRYTHDTYTDAQEAFTSTLDINANEIYIDANLIPSSSLPFSGSGQNGNTYSVDGLSIVKYWYRQPLTKSDTNNEVWFFLNPSGSNDGIGAQLIDANQQTNFVSPKYSVSALTNANTEDATPGYGVKVIVAGTQVSTNNYVFDYKTGIVQFASTALAPSNGQVVTITAYQYVGRTLSSQIGSGTGVISSRLSRLEESTSSLNTFSASVNGHIADLNIKTGSLEQKNIIIAAYTASMNTFSASVNGHIADLNIKTGSLEQKNIIIAAYTASMNTFTSSQEAKDVIISAYTASMNTFSASVNGHIADLNTYTASLRTAFTASGVNVTFNGDQTIKGNLYVQGTQTQVDSTTINLADNILQLNAAGTNDGGLVVRDATGGSTTSGSLLWDVTNDHWKAGALGTEERILRAGGGDHIVSGSVQVDVTSTTGFTTYSGSISSSLTSNSASISALSASVASVTGEFSSSVSSTFVTQSQRITSLETFSGSQNTKNSTLASYTASVDGHIADLNIKTGSLEQKNIIISAYTASMNTFTSSQQAKDVIISAYTSSMNTFSASVNGHISDINTKTGSFEGNFITLSGYTASMNTFTSSQQAKDVIISAYTSSMNTFTSSQEAKDVIISAYTSSMNTFTASVNGHITDLNTKTGSLEQKNIIIAAYTASMNTFTSSQEAKDVIISAYTASMNVFSSSQEAKDVIISAYTASMNTFSASVNGHISDINTKTGSLEQKNIIIAAYTASMNTFTSSQEAKDVIISAYTASMNTFSASIYSFTQSFSASVSTSFSASAASVSALSTSVDSRLDTLEGTGTIQGVGTTNQVTFAKVTTTGDVVVGGDLVVQGNTVTLNTSQLVVEDKLISLASGSTNAATANGAGIEILGANATFTYDSTPNAWTANIPISASAVTASVNVPGFGGSKRMAFRSTIGNLDFVDAPTTAGDIPQWDGTNFVMSNVIDGGTY